MPFRESLEGFLALMRCHRHSTRMMFGRLIRVGAYRHDPAAAIYVVAEADPQEAIQILKIALVRPQDDYEDLGRVTDTLLNALSLQPGQCART
jgi:hypothetical protein